MKWSQYSFETDIKHICEAIISVNLETVQNVWLSIDIRISGRAQFGRLYKTMLVCGMECKRKEI